MRAVGISPAHSPISANKTLWRASQDLPVLVPCHRSRGVQHRQLKVSDDGAWGYRLKTKKTPLQKIILPSSLSRCREFLLSYLLCKTTVTPMIFFLTWKCGRLPEKQIIGMETSWISLRQLNEYALWRRRRVTQLGTVCCHI